MRRHRRDYEMMSDMNLTNLLDTAFVLLIAFLIASPSVRHGIQIDLPQVQGDSLQSTDQSTNLTIVIKKQQLEGAEEPIYVNDQRISLDDLRLMIIGKQRINPKLAVIVEADKEATYNAVAQVIGLLKAMGIESVGLPTEPVDLEALKNKNKPTT